MKKRKKLSIPQALPAYHYYSLLFMMVYPLAMSLWNAFKSQSAYDYTKWYPTLPRV